ncbi:conserved hypothetical protein [Desulfamplus magnetovallimortis]|uniref:4Fe-4S ferredoxin-type domain-containing protein n=1 Tax=Desulfamplus magnetovallimortis TaxID=1246637 RepID=A0A1W1HD36_9BACT|nr:DUF362 domain-containing protein [Desulfamplus magnetovallimortis]SLM30389.1 conserved hypothetical protein [Desulfamplus magnetovallimortis]
MPLKTGVCSPQKKYEQVIGERDREYNMTFRFNMIQCITVQDIRKKLADALDAYRDILPCDKDALILLKPNLNSNMNALTGNTTDLRILASLVLFLKDEGYTNIVIGDGTNSGFYRNNISVISRLGVDRLAQYYGVKVKDLNRSGDLRKIVLDRGVKAHVAGDVMDAQLLINLPKLKTHFENGMSVCLKNLMGCLVGQENKKKIHDNLPENILRLNNFIKPHLHIVDALVAMEGLGPTKGTPVRMDRILIGTDPYLIDLLSARMTMFDFKKVRTLSLAVKKEIVTKDYFDFVDSLDLSCDSKKFAPPKAGPLAAFIHSPERQKFFLKIRNTPFFSYLASTEWFGKFLFLTNLRQDVFKSEEMLCRELAIDHSICNECGICKALCPLNLDLPGDPEMKERCIKCMYCYSACPLQAVKFTGEMGFFSEQVKQYGKLTAELY